MTMELLEQKAVEIIDKLQGPGMGVALKATQMQALACFFGGLLWIVIGVGIVIIAKNLIKVGKKRDSIERTFGGGILMLIGAIVILADIAQAFDPWNFIAFYHPDYWIAHQLLRTIGA